MLLDERVAGGFPDDRDAPGPTLVSTASLEDVARWLSLDLDECRRRFRANIEVGDCERFWEDAFASPVRPDMQMSSGALTAGSAVDPYADLPPPEPREFTVGDARFRATNVCRRCPVPARDGRTAAETGWFRDIFEARRRQALRPDVDAAEWGTLYRLAVNTTGLGDVPEGIMVGDAVAGTVNDVR